MSILEGTESVTDAAAIIGITPSRLRAFIRDYWKRCPSGKGKPREDECRAIKIKAEIFPAGHAWQVPLDEIQRLKTAPRNGGRPRVGDSKRRRT